MQMGVASVVMKDVASGVLRDEAAAALEEAGDVGPIEKLQALLTRVRPPEWLTIVKSVDIGTVTSPKSSHEHQMFG